MRRRIHPNLIAVGALLTLLSLVGCEPSVSARYYKYSLDLTVNGRPVNFIQYLECSHVVAPTEGPGGPFHLRWQLNGTAQAAVRIDADRVLIFFGAANCENPLPRAIDEPVEVLDTSEPTAKLYIVHGNTNYDPVSIKRVYVEPVETRPSALGPTKEQRDLAAAMLAQYSHQFARVTVRVLPASIWAVSDAARQYFDQFKTVVVAKVGEAAPVSGSPRDIVRFPFYLDRAYPKVDGRPVNPPEAWLSYGTDAFELPSKHDDNLEIYYSPPGTTPASRPTVDYKGIRFTVRMIQEVYDPATREILSFNSLSFQNLGQVVDVVIGHSFL